MSSGIYADFVGLVRQAMEGADRGVRPVVPDNAPSESPAGVATTDGAHQPREDGDGRTRTAARRGSTGPARQGAPNDWGWRQQARLEVGPIRETTQGAVVEAGATIRLDPNLAPTWCLSLAGDATIEIADDEPIEGADDYTPVPIFTTHLVVAIARAPGSVIHWPAGMLWSADVVTPEKLVAPDPANASIDVFTLVRFPAHPLAPAVPSGWFGFLVGRGFAAPKEGDVT